MIRKNNFKYLLLIMFTTLVFLGLNVMAEDDIYIKEKNYSDYLTELQDAVTPDHEIIIKGSNYIKTNMDVKIIDNLGDLGNTAIKTEESSGNNQRAFIEWEFEVPESGLYNIAVKYYPIPGKHSEIQRQIEINGQVPFEGAKYLVFNRVWEDAGEIRTDNRGNQLRPVQAENPIWQEVDLRDYMGYYMEPYQFYFKKGTNTIRFISQREPMAIAYLKLYQKAKPVKYTEKLAEYQDKGYKQVKDIRIKIQAEDTYLKSEQTLYPVHDQGDPTLEDYHPAQIRLNSIGGSNWQKPSQWISWKFTVPESGLYRMAFKAKQNMLRGTFSNRRLKIDGKVPFREMEAIRFPYSSEYQMLVPENIEGEPLLVYLEKGSHVLEMEVVLGDLTEILRTMETALYEVNKMYRQILMITSSSPDPLRDYQLKLRIPDVIKNLKVQSEVIAGISDLLIEYTGQRGSHVALLDELSRQLSSMSENPETIPQRLGKYRDNLGALGTWILQTREQPLQLDYILVDSPEKELPRATPTMMQSIIHEIKAYIASYTFDYNMVGNIYEGEEREPINVWIQTGRDQAQQLKVMIEDSFSSKTGIPVNLQLVNMGTLLPATLAEQGPDIALGVPTTDPINFALRNAVVDLTGFEGFDEVKNRFKKSAIVPFTFRESVYALPEQQPFPMLFYRTDILQELGIEVPDTWDDVIKMIPELQKHNLNFGLPVSDERARRKFNAHDIGMATSGAGSLAYHPGVIPYLTFLFQNGGKIYHEDGVRSALDSEVSAEAFRQWTNLYELYNIPLQYDVANRFRVGEIPILITNYGLYNTLAVFAPEIKGRWAFGLVPGTRKEDGSIDRTIPGGSIGGGGASIILENAEDKEACWEFLKWWTSADTQTRYARELENLLGPAARYPAANVEAVKRLPWTVEEYDKLSTQWDYVHGVPEVPGGYMTGRHLDNAFRKVVYQKKEVRKTILDYVKLINEEIEIKRKEFNLETDIDILNKEKNGGL